LEATPQPVTDKLNDTSKALANDITGLVSRLDRLIDDLKVLQDDTKDTQALRGIGTLMKSLQARCLDPLKAWRDLLGTLSTQTPEEFIDWLEVTRIDGRAVDIGAYRHYRDPMQQFTNLMNAQAHGVVVTSATLKPNRSDNEQAWEQAEQRLGGKYLREQNNAALRVQIPSPFDYPKQTRVYLITDVDKDKPVEIANAYAQLFKASKGGGMGLFTAIKRLQAVYPYLKKSLDDIPLYAQHVDGLNTATLVDIFRAEEDACILGTDALRDGVDVPGRALRLLVYDRIPWPRADILHKSRRAYFGRDYDYFLTAMRLRQSFGRLVRTETDHGAFVLLESALPSRLHSAFPEGITIEKTTLSNACAAIEGFLAASEYAKVAA
jgi:ATP-dependent DNA helicase DinG